MNRQVAIIPTRSRAGSIAWILLENGGVLVLPEGREFKIHAKHPNLPLSPIKFRLEGLGRDALSTLAAILYTVLLDNFKGHTVVAVPRGALPLVDALPSDHAFPLLSLQKNNDGSFTLETEADPTRPVVLVENVVTTGESEFRSAECLIEAGYRIGGLVTLVDWGLGGMRNFSQRTNRSKVVCIAKGGDVARATLDDGKITQTQYEHTMDFITQARKTIAA